VPPCGNMGTASVTRGRRSRCSSKAKSYRAIRARTLMQPGATPFELLRGLRMPAPTWRQSRSSWSGRTSAMARPGFYLIEARAGGARSCRTVAARSPGPPDARRFLPNLLPARGVRVAAASRVRCIRQPLRSDVAILLLCTINVRTGRKTVPATRSPVTMPMRRLLLLPVDVAAVRRGRGAGRRRLDGHLGDATGATAAAR